MSWCMNGRAVISTLLERKMYWYKLQGDVRYIIQFLCKTDLEQVIVNGIQQGCQ